MKPFLTGAAVFMVGALFGSSLTRHSFDAVLSAAVDNKPATTKK